jgi:hypothetical protein
MNISFFLQPIVFLDGISLFFLAGLTVFIAWRGQSSQSRLRFAFCLLALSLLIWQATLFLEIRTSLPSLPLGRANFAAIAFAAYFALRFVQETSGKRIPQISFLSRWLLPETCLLTGLTLLTPLIVREDRALAGQAVTTFGALFPLYLLHVVAYLASALALAFREWRVAKDRRVRSQLALIGLGMVATGGIAFVTNALLPYEFGDFRFCDLGALSTGFFVAAVAYAAFLHQLFGLRILLRKALVYGILLAFVLGAYSSAVFLITEYLTENAGKGAQFATLLIAFSFDPLRRFLEEMTGHLLFERRKPGRAK